MQSEKYRRHCADHSTLCILHSALGSGVGFRLAQPGDPVPFLPLAAFLEDFQALEAFEDIPFSAQGGGGAKTAML